MGIVNLDLKNSYTGKGENILNEFLLPILKESISYDRITGYYTIESLLAISQGIESIFKRNGKMRLIIGMHSFPAELAEANLKRNYLKKQIDDIREEVIKQIASITDLLEKRRLATIAWMIEDELLEVKVASVKGRGIFHPKTLIFTDHDGNKVAAVGSSNETANGLGDNFEQLMVAKSWDNYDAVKNQEDFFEELWNDENKDVLVCDITEEMAEMIMNSLGSEYANPNKTNSNESRNIIGDASLMPSNFFVSGDIPALFMHQERAVIDALSRWPVRVLFADEVGLGKTFEAAATLVFLVKYCGVKRVMILTPKSVLKQWQDELYEHFGLDVYLYDSSAKEYISATGHVQPMDNCNPVGLNSPDLILMSSQYARGSESKKSIFELEDTVLPELLIVDEAHAARISRTLNESKKKTRLYKVLKDISTKIPHIILATATPMQKDAEEYHAMLMLLGLPGIWKKERAYNLSLKLIGLKGKPDLSDAAAAATLLYATLQYMKPSIAELNLEEKIIIEDLIKVIETKDKYKIGAYVIEKWELFQNIFIRLHPARLLTIRNTRRSLEEVGYAFPKRNLKEETVSDSDIIQLFYNKVDEYLTNTCFLIEKELYPVKDFNTGFVRISYQQRVASSLYSCKESLKNRYDKVLKVKTILSAIDDEKSDSNVFEGMIEIDELDEDEITIDDVDIDLSNLKETIDFKKLKRAVSLESTSLSSLIKEVEELLEINGDLKIKTSIKKALECLNAGDSVLVFSRYTDTIDGLIEEFNKYNKDNKFVYAIYTGKTSVIVKNEKTEECSKNRIRQELQDRTIRIVFCSDAASEGLNLQAARVLINVDVPWTPARLEQRIGRIARLGQVAREVDIYNIWYPYSIEAKMYHRIQSRLEETNLAIGEFPEVVSTNIKKYVTEGFLDDDKNIDKLLNIRNTYQIKALEDLWYNKDIKYTSTDLIRKQLIDICDNNFDRLFDDNDNNLKRYRLPDGSIEVITEVSGMPESISLKSEIFKHKNVTIPKVLVVNSEDNIPMAFAYSKPELLLKHEEVMTLENEIFNEEMLIAKRPKMLPDQEKLSLDYAVECSVNNYPKLWIE